MTEGSRSALNRYQRVVVGSHSLVFTVKYELITSLFSDAPGAVGLWLRRRFYRGLFNRIGRGLVLGRHVSVLHPGKIVLGDDVIIADGCALDARGDKNRGIVVESNVVMGRRAALVCKDGDITVGRDVGIGTNSLLSAVAGNHIEIGDHVLLGPYTYLGGHSYHFERTDIPIALQDLDGRGGVRIEDNVWLGARVTVLDGVTIGRDAIIAAGAVVNRDIPPFAVAMGVPAKVNRTREPHPVGYEPASAEGPPVER